jgi:Zn-dependent protease
MLFRNLDLLRYDPLAFFRLILVVAVAVAIAIAVHEFSHALAATRLGDDTARLRGRLSLNPLVHLDPMGTLFLFLVGFGWGKPVPVNEARLREGHRGMGKVALAGPVSGLMAAALMALVVRATGITLGGILLYAILLNIILSLFNLIPLPPLDGHKVAVGFLPRSLSLSFQGLERYGIMPLFLLIIADNFLGIGILWGIIGPGVNFFTGLFLGEALL